MTSRAEKLAVTAVLFLGWFSAKIGCAEYVFPEAAVKVWRSGGFEVSIPDSEGVQLFSFHGKINRELGHLQVGDISGDVQSPEGGRWVFRDSKHMLKKGDKIYYWLYVQRNRLGYRKDAADGCFEVKEFTDAIDGSNSTRRTTSSSSQEALEENRPETTLPQPSQTDVKLSACQGSLANVTQLYLREKSYLEKARDLNDILWDIVRAHPEPEVSRYLTFGGSGVPQDGDALEVARRIVKDVLKLPVEVVGAKRVGKEIAFVLAGLDDKIAVIKEFKPLPQGGGPRPWQCCKITLH